MTRLVLTSAIPQERDWCELSRDRSVVFCQSLSHVTPWVVHSLPNPVLKSTEIMGFDRLIPYYS